MPFRLLAALFLVFLGGATILWRSMQPGCAGDQWPIAYDVELDEFARDLSPGGVRLPPDHARLAGKLSVGRDGAAFVARFTPQVAESGGAAYREFKDYKTGVELRLDRRCAISQIVFDGRETFAARATFQRLLGTLDLGRAPGNVVEAEDGFGRSRYVRVEGDGAVLRRAEVLSQAVTLEPEARLVVAAIESSELRYGRRGEALWPHDVRVTERLKVERGPARRPAEIAYTLTMKRSDDVAPAVAASAIPPNRAVAMRVGQAPQGLDVPSAYDTTTEPDGGLPKDVEEAEDRFFEVVGEDARRAKLALIAYLRAYPEALAEFATRIRAGYYDDDVLVHLLHAIAKADTNAAQSSLATLAKDQAVDLSTKLRVLFAAGEVSRPNAELVGAVRELYADLRGGDDTLGDLDSTALLTAGAMITRLREVDPALVEELASDLRQVFDSATAAGIRAVAVEAAGNGQLLEFEGRIVPLLASVSEVERKAAYEAVGRIPIAGREARVSEALLGESSPLLRRVATKSLAAIGLSSAETVATLAKSLATERDAEARKLGVGVLAERAALMPAAKEALLAHLAKDSNPHVLAEAGRFLSAYDLAAVARQRSP